MRRLSLRTLSAILVLTPWLSVAAQQSAANAVHFPNTAYSTPDVFWAAPPVGPGGPVKSSTAFLSFWYNVNQPETATLFVVADVKGDDLLRVGFSVGPSPSLEVDAIDDFGNCAHATTENVANVLFDGQWHNVILSLWVDSSGMFRADIVIDAALYHMAEAGYNNQTVYSFHEWNWPVAISYSLGVGYIGDMAEFFLDLEADTTVGPLQQLGAIIDLFIDRATLKAPGLGWNCEGVNGTIPNMCHRGDSCNFTNGCYMVDGRTISYFLDPVLLPGASALSSAFTGPCLYTAANPNQAIPYVVGTGCPNPRYVRS